MGAGAGRSVAGPTGSGAHGKRVTEYVGVEDSSMTTVMQRMLRHR